jgi:acyl-CoA thioester hydrolase
MRFKYTRRAFYHETDKMGIIHHSNYVKWMEEARVDFLKEIGMGYREIEEAGIASPVVSISVEYKKQVRFDDEILIEVSIEKYNGISFELAYEFTNLSEQEVCTVASSKHCFLKDGKLISLKRELPDFDTAIREYMNNGRN